MNETASDDTSAQDLDTGDTQEDFTAEAEICKCPNCGRAYVPGTVKERPVCGTPLD